MSAVGRVVSQETGLCDLLISPKAKTIFLAITQLATRILFIFSSIWIAGILLPVAFHAIVLPMIGLGATALASFFFLPDVSPVQKPFECLPPLFELGAERPLHFEMPLPAGIPVNAPRGIYRTGNNCWVNAMAQILECEPFIAHWIRTPLPLDLEPFIAYLAQYELSPRAIQEFRHFALALAPPQPIPDAFGLFLNAYRPDDAERIDFNNFRLIYPNLKAILPNFNQFFGAYDQALAQNQAAVSRVDSQVLRSALSSISPLNSQGEKVVLESPATQADAGEAMAFLLDLLPKQQKIQIYEEHHYNLDGVRDDWKIAENPAGKLRREQPPAWGFDLKMDPKEVRPDLQQMMKAFCNDETIPDEPIRHKSVGGEFLHYIRSKKVTQIVRPPPSLRLHINRTYKLKTPNRWLAKVLPKMFFRNKSDKGKLKQNVAVPEIFPLPTQTGISNYRLTGFYVHEGNSMDSGHWISFCCVENGGQMVYFKQNDETVTLLDRAAWLRAAEQSSLTNYLLV